MKTTLVWVLGSILLAVGSISLLRFIPTKAVHTRVTDTLSICQRVLIDIDLMGKNDAANIFLNSTNSSFDLNRKFVATVQAQKIEDSHSMHSIVSADGLIYDKWGSPLLFALSNSPSYEKLNPRLKRRARPVVVWSAGPNGTNDWGSGDDVFSEY